jgi:hypothetical protein
VDIFRGGNISVPIVSAIIGAIILLFGRRLFWLCVAAIGFAGGVELAAYLVHEPSPLLQLTLAILLGFVGALFALFLQRLAIAVAGFVAGGRLAIGLAASFIVHYAEHYWLIFLIGGVIGALLLLLLFDWALVFISALIGAHLITGALTLPPTGRMLVFVVVVVCGVLVQAAFIGPRRPAVPSEH